MEKMYVGIEATLIHLDNWTWVDYDLSRLIRRWSLAVGACLAISQKDHWTGLDCPALWDVLLVPSVAENVTEP